MQFESRNDVYRCDCGKIRILGEGQNYCTWEDSPGCIGADSPCFMDDSDLEERERWKKSNDYGWLIFNALVILILAGILIL